MRIDGAAERSSMAGQGFKGHLHLSVRVFDMRSAYALQSGRTGLGSDLHNRCPPPHIHASTPPFHAGAAGRHRSTPIVIASLTS